MSGSLIGKSVVITGADGPIGHALALAVKGAGARTALLGDIGGLAGLAAAMSTSGDDVIAVDMDFTSRERVAQAFAVAADRVRAPIDAVVHAYMPAVAFERLPFDRIDDERWHAVWEGAMRAQLFVLQAGYEHMRGRQGRFLFVTPTVCMSGAAQLALYTAAVEGHRLLAKSAARQWGAENITVNCLAPPPEFVPIGVPSGALALAPPALNRAGGPDADLGPITVHLLSDAGRFITGATISVDGGVWMAP
jgi:3-oxoacyl-[acyl-carrier protein] reductase